jgi:hypothetical protein
VGEDCGVRKVSSRLKEWQALVTVRVDRLVFVLVRGLERLTAASGLAGQVVAIWRARTRAIEPVDGAAAVVLAGVGFEAEGVVGVDEGVVVYHVPDLSGKLEEWELGVVDGLGWSGRRFFFDLAFLCSLCRRG